MSIKITNLYSKHEHNGKHTLLWYPFDPMNSFSPYIDLGMLWARICGRDLAWVASVLFQRNGLTPTFDVRHCENRDIPMGFEHN